MDRYCPLKMNAASSAVRVYTAVGSGQLLKIALFSITASSGLREKLTSFPFKHAMAAELHRPIFLRSCCFKLT